MKNYYCVVLLFLMTTSGIFAQVNFEKGHFITESDQKIECYIKNEDWNNTPSKFEYKETLDGDVKVLRLGNFKTLVIDNAFKFEKHTVQFDDSSRALNELSFDRNPNFKEKTVLLNVLIEGKVTLLSYIDNEIRAYYYKKGTGKVAPLIYKVFTTEDRKILYNTRYRQQLLTEFPCDAITENTILKTDYSAGDLSSFFLKYNECEGETAIQYKKTKKGTFHGRVFGGFYNSSSDTELELPVLTRSGIDMEAAWAPTFGVELEYVLPFNKNKWSVFIAPNYSSYEGEGSFFDLMVERRFSVEYSAIQIPIGFRHSMFINDNSKIFLSGAVLIDIPLTTGTGGNVTLPEGDFRTSAGTAIGIGYSYDKYSIEARYLPNRELLERSTQASVKLNQFSITVGYTIF
ncbi:hypothetical protein H2O64_04010 [Kordia sp. YSTF-M3]|uniref:Outer membrane beta-barrel protein n=1 Tax=Kordia aestuariivivens TaxID=2759037 RepID=A0ABR7Q5I7_9FLAO|nr:hypothetical protein [Kordia aestuariivivens]MBC8753820.1 hypothetical protein [Kordia aestuariivivens]